MVAGNRSVHLEANQAVPCAVRRITARRAEPGANGVLPLPAESPSQQLAVQAHQPADPTLYSARVGSHYRVIGKLKGDTVIWDWIGSREEYNNLIHKR